MKKNYGQMTAAELQSELEKLHNSLRYAHERNLVSMMSGIEISISEVEFLIQEKDRASNVEYNRKRGHTEKNEINLGDIESGDNPLYDPKY